MSHLSKLIFFLSIFLSSTLLAQNRLIDSLKVELTIHKQKDTIKVNLLNQLASLHRNKDLEQCLDYIKKSEFLADSLGYTRGKAQSIYIKGITQRAQSKIDKGFEYINEAFLLYKSINDKSGLAKCYNSLGILFFHKGDKEKAAEFYNKAVLIYKEINNTVRVAYCYNNLGVIYSDVGNYTLALDFYDKSFRIAKKNKNQALISNSLANIGSIYFYLENYDKAKSNYEELLKGLKPSNKKNIAKSYSNLGLIYKEQKNFEKAYEMLNKAVIIYREIANKFDVVSPLNNIGDLYFEQKKYNPAFNYYIEGKKISLEVRNVRGLCNSHLGLAKIYFNQKNINKALKNALKSKELSIKSNLLTYQKEVELLLSKIYYAKGNYKEAFKNHLQYKKLNDSIFNKKNIEKIAQLEYDYKHKKELDSIKIRELELSKTVESTEKNLKESEQNLFIGIILFLLFLMILGGYIFILKYKNFKAKAQNTIIEQKLLRSQMTPHFIFNSLSVLQGMILNKENTNANTYLSKFSKLLRTVLENSRHKKVLLKDELKAIESFMELQNLDVNPPFKFKLIVDANINKETLKIPPMLIQPFIENAIEHAFPKRKENKEINIELKLNNHKLFCVVKDNGIGVDVHQQKNNNNKKSLATKITSERLKVLSKEFKTSGGIEIKNRKTYGEQGTIVTLVIPYKNEVA